jgi:GAF domain-containing protein
MMKQEPKLPSEKYKFITSDGMAVTILIYTAIALIAISILVLLAGENPVAAWLIFAAAIIDIGGIFLARRGNTLPGRILVPGLLVLVIGFIAYNGGGLNHISIAGFPVVIVLAGLMLGGSGAFIFAAIASVESVFIGIADINKLLPFAEFSRTSQDDIGIAVALFVLTAFVLWVIINRLTESAREAEAFGRAQETANIELISLQSELEHRVEQRTAELDASNQRNINRAKQFEAIALVARSISSTQDFEVLLPQITKLISREFGFYHVGIFLLDSRKDYAVLSAANSEGGQRMLERNHRLLVGETGIVGYVTSTGKARVALDTGTDAAFFNNPDLPETRSEIALPLQVGDEIIGALDVQSTESNAFHEEDINVLGTLADQVSIAIQNAKQFEATRKALTESDILSRQFVQTGWRQFTKSQNLIGVRHTGAKATLLYARNKKEKGNGTGTSNREQLQSKTRGASLSLPVKLRGEVIGSVNVHAAGNRQFDQDELDIVTAIIERAAIAMENARLLAESQKRAAKERTIGEISAKISAQSDIHELLKVAAQELNHTLPGTEIAIQFQKHEEAE